MVNNEGKSKSPFWDGIFKKNSVLVSGLIIAPVVFIADTLAKAIALIVAFSIITLVTVVVSSFIPRNIVYTIRIILYSIISALVYVPVYILEVKLFSEQVAEMGIMLPLLITNSLILSKSELRFFRQKKGSMVLDVISYIIGFDIATLIIAFIREVFGRGELLGKVIGIPLTIPALIYPFGAFILIGLCAALLRKIQSYFSE